MAVKELVGARRARGRDKVKGLHKHNRAWEEAGQWELTAPEPEIETHLADGSISEASAGGLALKTLRRAVLLLGREQRLLLGLELLLLELERVLQLLGHFDPMNQDTTVTRTHRRECER